MPQQNQRMDYATQSDEFNVMLKKAVNYIDSYMNEAIAINDSLLKAKASLQNTPGVQNAIAAIDQSIAENEKRGNQGVAVQRYEARFFQKLQTDFLDFQQKINTLQMPEQPTNQTLIGNGKATPVNNMNNQQGANNNQQQ